MMLANETKKETRSSLAPYLQVDRIHVGLEFASKKRLLEFLAEKLSINDDAKQQKRIFHALIEREKLGSTGIGNGMAIPHGRCPKIHTATLCIITLKKAVDYESIDDQAVDLVFGLITPEDANEEHLHILSQIAELLRMEHFKKDLNNVKTPDELLTFVTNKLV